MEKFCFPIHPESDWQHRVHLVFTVLLQLGPIRFWSQLSHSVIPAEAANSQTIFLKNKRLPSAKQCKLCSIGINAASRNGLTASYLSNTRAGHKNGGNRAAARFTWSTFTEKGGATLYAGGESDGISSLYSTNCCAVDGSSDPLLLHDPKDIALSSITSSALLSKLQVLQSAYHSCSPWPALQEQSQSSASLEMARRVVHYCRLLHFVNHILSPAPCLRLTVLWRTASALPR